MDQSDIGRRNPNVIPGGSPPTISDLNHTPGGFDANPVVATGFYGGPMTPHKDSGTTNIAADVAGWYLCCMTGWAPGRPNRSSEVKEVGYSLQTTHQLTELRLTELVALRPDQADLDAQRISLNGNGKRRLVPIPRCAAVSPQTLRRGATSAPEFPVRLRQPRVRPRPPVPRPPRVSVGPRAVRA